VPPRIRLQEVVDKIIAALFALLLLGAVVAFGGAVWWWRTALWILTSLIVFAWLGRALLTGRWQLFKSPLTLLGLMAIALAFAQLAPMPAPLAARLMPRSAATAGGQPRHMKEPAADASLRKGATVITVDRSATLRWAFGAICGLAIFVIAAHFSDRLSHTLVLWGSVVAGFAICTVFGVVQVAAGFPGLYGVLQPGSAPEWAPSLADLASAPHTATLRLVPDRRQPKLGWPVARPERPFAIGSLMGGPGAYVALGAMALPLALGLVLHMLSPRGSRETIGARLRSTGRSGLSFLLLACLFLGAGLVGYVAGPWLALPFTLGLLVTGLAPAKTSGLGWTAVGITAVTLACLGVGAGLGYRGERLAGSSPLTSPLGFPAAAERWTEAIRVARDYPIVGAGLGGFATIEPYYKAVDRAVSTAGSSLLQWWAETGGIGLALLFVAGLWCLVRMPGAVRRVGSGDRALPFALVGAVVAFGLLSVVHWTLELSAIGIAACALGGVLNRWLAGGTDLFVEAV
jgi:hypothetical protein